MALLGLFPFDRAAANNECGFPQAREVTCTAEMNPHANGIHYATQNNLTINLASGVIVRTSNPTARGVQIIAGSASGARLSIFGGPGVSIETSGDSAIGVLAFSPLGSATVHVDSVRTSGDLSTGVHVVSILTDVRVHNVTTTGNDAPGVFARGHESVTVVVADAIDTSGVNSRGVMATGRMTVEVVNAGDISTAGAFSEGIYAVSDGPDPGGSVVVNSRNTSARDAVAIYAESAHGPTALTVTGTTISARHDAIIAIGETGASVAVESGATVLGGLNAIVIRSGTGAATSPAEAALPARSTVTNAGVITAGDGFAILASGAPVQIRNSGTINGRISLTDNDDLVVNTGTFNAEGRSEFGAGADGFRNDGVLRAQTASLVTFAGVESFSNSGLIDLRNGQAGNSLVLTGVFVGSGQSQLALDVVLDATGSASDLLVVGSATGETEVLLAVSGGPARLNPGQLLIQSGAASSPTAFRLADSSADQGLIHFSIIYDPTTFDYSLVGVPGASVYRMAKYSEGAANTWLAASDAWRAGLQSRRDGGGDGPRTWLQVQGSEIERDSLSRTTVFGQTSSFDLSYGQTSRGAQFGAEGSPAAIPGLLLGVTGGLIDSRVSFTNSREEARFETLNFGGYASFSAGSTFVGMLAKYDWSRIDSDGWGQGPARSIDGEAWGITVEVGHRAGSSALFVEPVITVSWLGTRLEDFTVQGSSIGFEDAEHLRGSLGFRMGGDLGPTVALYGGAVMVREFEGKDGLTFHDSTATLEIANESMPDYSQGHIGLRFSPAAAVSGFVEGFAIFGGDDGVGGGGGRVGVSARF
ncbi:MAG TPA: hypothetical protein PLO65_00610 [Caulobacter sp.]|nr:hypothetical protein [Caulobacter sp.]